MAEFRAVGWRRKVFWFRPHERAVLRRLFDAAAGGPAVLAAELPRSMAADRHDARDVLIVDAGGGRVSLAERPRYYLAGLGRPPTG
jgi:hypothetical protein